MIRKRIIPLLLLKDGRMVKGKQFAAFRDVGNPVTTARIYNAQKADELIFLDIFPSQISREAVRQIIQSVARECFMPLTVGGGISTLEEVRQLLAIGADKVAINTAAVEQPELLIQASEAFGNQSIIVSVDYRTDQNGRRTVFTHSGKVDTGLDPIVHIRQCVERGAGEILLTSIDHEGMMAGYDQVYLQEVGSDLPIPLIASGGAGSLQDFQSTLMMPEVQAISAGSIFHFTDQSPVKARFFLYNAGVPVRVD